MESDVRDLDTAPKASIDTVGLNNQVVFMRKTVKKARIQVINKLTRQIRKLKPKGESGLPGREKSARRLERLKAEMEVIKGLNADKVSKYALASTTSFADVCKQQNASEVGRAMARLADNAVLQKAVKEFRSKHADWPSLAAYLLAKTTNRKFKKKKKKVKQKNQGKKQEVKRKVDAFTLELRLKSKEKLEKDKTEQKQKMSNAGNTATHSSTLAQSEKKVISPKESIFSKQDIPGWDHSSESDGNDLSDSDKDNMVESGSDASGEDDEESTKPSILSSMSTTKSVVTSDMSKECTKTTVSSSEPIARPPKTSVIVEKETEEMVVKKLDLRQLPDTGEVLTKSGASKMASNLKVNVFGDTGASKTGHNKDPFFQCSDDSGEEEREEEDDDDGDGGENVTESTSSRPVPPKRRFESTFVGALNKPRKLPDAKSKPKFERDNRRGNPRQPSRPEAKKMAATRKSNSSRPQQKLSAGKPWTKTTEGSAVNKEQMTSLHPSWEASKKRKQQQSAVHAFQGKRIKFEDSDDN
ncbi:serum response factor-binding protein 1-like isoform X2 [Lingula anatina]|uniref:Serum response factor-binding protein 1-like isoform X2 n=1 Tax=Lingula anatina TaxID=7574 RepID=A0A2R2MIP1_LINAN|nr:serum response factor-binding protein 1-like isoform X2 [Lingula anatina]|eukprot:XP_023930090.1 serum response factor-binding protein 1-like isoform X2 [Lingula anatina]